MGGRGEEGEEKEGQGEREGRETAPLYTQILATPLYNMF